MSIVLQVVLAVLWIFLLCLIARVVMDLLQHFARDFRPHGVVLLLFEAVYTVTDPPLRAVRRVIPPLNLGGIALDLAFIVLLISLNILIMVVSAFASSV